ncbi:HSCB C-terminal oligomerization domain-containing protein [Parachaetomium inaequale]|uniref:HSCB C-terminal oligomerization domain-containing protein n=1 Tax=Parachaetomium inaequale TaxID=2588326 RepID=A0AAN6SNE8_9PEZI|nr:HSCB C-terminal oligomerization domain-containing protein [Parachaetomium inaequale]
MRASLVSSSARAATVLCAACRREARATLATRSPSSRAAATTTPRRALQTAATPPVQKTTTTPRRPTATQSRSSSTHPPAASTTSPPSPPSPSAIPTYYALFPETLPNGPPPTGKFPIDLRALRTEFLRLQAASHPDFHHSASQQPSPSPSETNNNNNTKSPARIRAEATSSLINAAYKTLSSPLLRAQYLLREQHGVDLEGDEAGAHTGAPDPELLMTVLEAREVMEEAETEADLEEVRVANEERIDESEQKLGEALEKGDVQGAKEEAVRLRYWVNIREGVRGWERGRPLVLQH